MNIQSERDKNRDEYPVQRCLQTGDVRDLSDHELLAVILGSGCRGEDVLSLSFESLRNVRSLRGLASSGLRELSSMKGIGPVKAVRIMAAFEMGRRVLGKELGEECSSPSAVWRLLLPDIAGLEHEILILLVLNNKNQVLRKKTVSVGTVSESLVHPREIFREAIRESGSRIIIAHNHPAGDLTPSADDLRTTRRIQAAGDLMGIPLMDHLVLTETGYRSLREEGFLKAQGG